MPWVQSCWSVVLTFLPSSYGISSGRQFSTLWQNSRTLLIEVFTTHGGTVVSHVSSTSLGSRKLIFCYSIMGSIRPRLEPTGAQLPASACLSFLNIFHARQQAYRNVDHVLPFCLCARIGHVVHIQETQRLPLDAADVAGATRAIEPD
jgi:hypothetical protein